MMLYTVSYDVIYSFIYDDDDDDDDVYNNDDNTKTVKVYIDQNGLIRP